MRCADGKSCSVGLRPLHACLVTLMITISLSGCLGGNEAELEAEIADNDQIIANNNLVITELEAESKVCQIC